MVNFCHLGVRIQKNFSVGGVASAALLWGGWDFCLVWGVPYATIGWRTCVVVVLGGGGSLAHEKLLNMRFYVFSLITYKMASKFKFDLIRPT